MDATPINEYERTVISLVVSGVPDTAIAKQVNVSHRTFERHLAQLMRRIGAPGRAALGALAVHYGWIDIPRLFRRYSPGRGCVAGRCS